MTQAEIENTIIDVEFDENQIHHVQYPNSTGVKGISIVKGFMRRPLKYCKRTLGYDGYDLTKIEEFERQLLTE